MQNIRIIIRINSKQGYALKNWVEGLSDYKKKIDLNRSTLHLPPNKRKFQFIKKSEGQNHRKQAKINVAFHHFPSLGLNEPQ